MRIRLVALALALLGLTPEILLAQQTNGVIAGVARDATGGVLPGVTVEVASPALIERVRSVVTGDDGQYRIVELRPGAYSITFMLAGFGKLVRDNVQLTSGFTATVNAELKVGDVAETITVTGGSPVVDLQNVTQQSVLSKTTLEAIPTGRSYTAVGKLIPGVDASGITGGHDVGGSAGRDATKLIYHGSATNDFKLMIDGMPQMTFIADGSVGVPPADNMAEEISLQYSALPAEVETGGVLYNMVPKTGSNVYHGSFFGNFATSAMQTNNVTDKLLAQGFPPVGNLDYVVDLNPSFGGPIKQDRIWFFATYRDFRPYSYSILYPDAVKNDWVYTPDPSQPLTYDAKPQKSLNTRFTVQATPRNRINLGFELSRINQINYGIGGRVGLIAREATPDIPIRHRPVVQLGWSAPLSNRLLIDVGGQVFRGLWWSVPHDDVSVGPPAIELATNTTFRASTSIGVVGYGDSPFWHDYLRGAVTYTTGSHAIKVGGTLFHGGQSTINERQGFGPYIARLLNGAPNGVTYFVDKNSVETRFLKGAIFAQDQWTVGRLTANYGVRIDTQNSGYPAQHEPANDYFAARDFPAESVLSWQDWSPRLGVALDVFGNGKTAVKASYSRYVNWDATGFANTVNPALTSGATLQRTWNDALVCATCIPGDFVPQGDPTNPLPNGEIGVSPNATWGTPRLPARYDPAWSQGGWGVRGYNWERSVSVQQELRSNVSVNVGYFYRTYGNFPITINAATTPADYDSFCITGPRDPRLPDGGAQQICGLYDVKPAAVSRLDNLTTLASNYGHVEQNYKGFDASINLRLPKALLQGGLNTGRELYDFCDTVAAAPERLIAGSTKVPADQCHQEQPFLSQVKLLGSYELPWAVSVSATYQNSYNTTSVSPNLLPGQPRMGIAANYVATNAVIAPSLGRNLSAGANGNAMINLVTPGTLWGDRLQQVDLRVGRTFKTGRLTMKAMFDLYNLTNTNTATTYNNAYGTDGAAWLTPIAILPGRLVKVGVQIDY